MLLGLTSVAARSSTSMTKPTQDYATTQRSRLNSHHGPDKQRCRQHPSGLSSRHPAQCLGGNSNTSLAIS